MSSEPARSHSRFCRWEGDAVGEREILRAIDEAYAAFAGTRKPRLPSMDPWRPDAEWIGRQSLREVPAAVISKFADELASGVIGDAEDVRYLAPRLLELAFRDELVSVLEAPVLVALAFSRARWTDWSSREQAAIGTFLAEYLDWSIAGRHAATVQPLVTALAILFDDLTPWLRRIRAHQDVPGVFALLWIADLGVNDAFLDGRSAQRTQLLAWLREPASVAQVDAVKARVGLVAPDGEDLHWLFERVSYWLNVRRAEPT